MFTNKLLSGLLITIFVVFSCASSTTRPNVVVILADDMGWNDVSFHGSDQFFTPNIDSLAYSGVILERYYTHPICTPSRSAFLTGKYSYTMGMQGYPLSMSEDRGIPTDIPLLPQYFRKAGYATHLVGKWHVGGSRREFLPTFRGFQSHFGHRGGMVDYFEYTYDEDGKTGMALFRNLTAAWDVKGYITDVYSERAASVIASHDTSSPLFLMLAHNAPHAGNDGSSLQAPPETVRSLRHVELSTRRMYAAMVTKLDDSVGEIVEALYKKGILENTIIVFASDNGGMTSGMYANYASNYPLRGIKTSPYEGGVRVNGLIWSANLNNTNHYYDGYMHSTDWLPTLLSAAGLEVPSGIDGVNQWESINFNSPSKRDTFYEIDDYTGFATITHGEFKLVTGTAPQSVSTSQGGNLTGVIGETPCYTTALQSSRAYKALKSLGWTFNKKNSLNLRKISTVNCGPPPTSSCFPDGDVKVCLYNIIEDPCEHNDLSAIYPHVVVTLQDLLAAEVTRMVPRVLPVYRDPLADPRRFNYTWDYWIY